MALKAVSMEELKLQVLFESERTGETIAELCARHGISRAASYYRYRRRYLEEGLAGLAARSRRPRHSPAQIEPPLEARIVELRKRHRRWGARRIHAELERAGVEPPAQTCPRFPDVQVHGYLVYTALGDVYGSPTCSRGTPLVPWRRY